MSGMTGVTALSLMGVMCCAGVLLRRRVPLFRTYLVPATVIAGILGVLAMNLGAGSMLDVDAGEFGSITTVLFTLTFISIGLTAPPDSDNTGNTGNKQKRRVRDSPLLRGAWLLGITWCLLFAVQELIGYGVVQVTGSVFGMPAEYGLMAAFGFAQGPGQAATFGEIFAAQGWDDAAAVGFTFAALGFLAAFVVGVPLARRGIARGLPQHTSGITESTRRGIFHRAAHDERAALGRETTFSGSIESLSLALSLVGVCYLLALGISTLFALVPGFVGETMSGMMFVNGLLAAYLVRWLLGKLGAAHVIDADLQRRITGMFSDFTVVAAFMAVQLAVVMDWIVPILAVTVVVAVVTLVLSVYLGQRFGSDHDFERTLGIFGTGTGTTPTGLSLVRIVDPRLRTQTSAEMGLMNIPEILNAPVMLAVTAVFAGAVSVGVASGIIAVCIVVYLGLVVWAGNVRTPTFRLLDRKPRKDRALVPESSLDAVAELQKKEI